MGDVVQRLACQFLQSQVDDAWPHRAWGSEACGVGQITEIISHRRSPPRDPPNEPSQRLLTRSAAESGPRSRANKISRSPAVTQAIEASVAPPAGGQKNGWCSRCTTPHAAELVIL
jgi:hypothetical protein